MKIEQMNQSAHLEELQKQLQAEQEVLQVAKNEAAAAQRKAEQSRKLIGLIERQIERAITSTETVIKGGPTVSDHAIVRYLERRHGLNMDGVRAEMLDLKTMTSILFLNGARGKVKSGDLVFVVENNVIITVLPGDAA